MYVCVYVCVYIYIYIYPHPTSSGNQTRAHIYIYISLSLSLSLSLSPSLSLSLHRHHICFIHIYLCICICVCVNVHASMSVCGFVLFCFPALRSSWGLWFRLQAETCQAKHESEEWNKKTGSAALKCQDQTPVSTQRHTSKVQTKDFPSRIAKHVELTWLTCKFTSGPSVCGYVCN